MNKAFSSTTPQMLHKLSAACRWKSGGLPVMLIAGAMFGIATPAAQATHFRFGHIHAGPGTQPNEVKFVVQTVWRLGPGSSTCIDPTTGSSTPCSGPGGIAAIGDIVANSPGGLGSFAFGDGSTAPPRYLVTSISPVTGGDNWYFGVLVDTAQFPNVVPTVSHTYAAPGQYTAHLSSCCRISPQSFPNRHINNPDRNFSVRATVDVGTDNSTPVALIPPIVLCPIDDVCSIPIQAVDPDGDTLRFRFSTPSETGDSGFLQPGPPHAPNAATIDPDTGLLTWDTTGASLGGVDPIDWNVLYSTHVTIEDLDGDDNVKSSVALDFFIRLVPAVGPAPQFNDPDPFDPPVIHAMVGDTVNFNVSVKPGEEPDPECGDPGTGDCCEAQSSSPYCEDQDCCELICADDPFCCDVNWDSLCADAANDQCAVCAIIEASDTCEDAEMLTCGAEVIGSTVDATYSDAGFCVTTHTAPEVWYRLIGTGDEITVTTCDEASDYDTKLSVWTGDCDALVCVGGNDDDVDCDDGLLSTVTFASVAGQEYFIMVHGFSAAVGTFGLIVDCVTATSGESVRPSVHGDSFRGHNLGTKLDNDGGGQPNVSHRFPSGPMGGGGPDPDELTLNVVGLPPGAVMDPELPITDIGSITSKFTWIPQPQHVGTHIVIYTATSAFGQSVQLPVTIIVDELEVLCGDLNFDDVVDNEDLVIFMDAFGSCDGDPNFNPLADYNGDGCVGMADLAIWYECYLIYLKKNPPDDDEVCVADLDGNGVVDGSDLLILLSSWGSCPGCPADLDGSDVVDGSDLLILLSAWGPCP